MEGISDMGNIKRYLIRKFIVRNQDKEETHNLVYVDLTFGIDNKVTGYSFKPYASEEGELPNTEYLDTLTVYI